MFRSSIVVRVTRAVRRRPTTDTRIRRLTDDDAVLVAYGLTRTASGTIKDIDVRMQISAITAELPTPSEVARVKDILRAADWAVADDGEAP